MKKQYLVAAVGVLLVSAFAIATVRRQLGYAPVILIVAEHYSDDLCY